MIYTNIGTQNVFAAAINSETQNSMADHSDRRPKRGEHHRPESVDKSPIYQQELAHAFKSAKKTRPGSKMSGNLGNMYTLLQVHPPPKQQMAKNHGSKQSQYRKSMAKKPNLQDQPLPLPPKSSKTQYKFMMTNNQHHQQQQQMQYHQSNPIDNHQMINSQMMDSHLKMQQQIESDQQTYEMNSLSTPQMPMPPQVLQHTMHTLMEQPEEGPIQMYMPMS